jgi:hypothetical protein
VNRLRNEVSNALLIPVQDAQDYVKVVRLSIAMKRVLNKAMGMVKIQIVKRLVMDRCFGIGRCFEVALSQAKPWRCA